METSENLRTFNTLLELLNRFDLEGVLELCTDDVYYRYGSAEPSVGKEGMRQSASSTHLDFLVGVRCELRQAWGQDDVVLAEMDIINQLRDGSTVSLPCTVMLRFREGKVREYRIFIDPTPLVARAQAREAGALSA